VARFEREVDIASRLTHPNTIEIFDFGRAPDGTPYYAMEYVEGINFADLVERFGAQAPARVAYLLRQVCGSLKEAHELGLVHRDIKPHNLMLCRLGGELDMVKVLDFGLVKDTTAPQARALTKSLRILGTPLYMSPERIRDASAADPRDDIYAVGAVGYLLLTGRPVFESDSDLDVATQVLNTTAQRPSRLAPQALPEPLDLAIHRCLAKSRADRPQAIDELMRIFDACMGPRPSREAAAQEWWTLHGAEVFRDDPPLRHTPPAKAADSGTAG
jgi:eukaryotic-like serine/threonine-protein kinase